MKFRYFEFPLADRSEFFGDTIFKPIIPVKISVGKKSLRYAALIDSGADFCIFHAEIADALGIDIQSGTDIEFAGIQEAGPAKAFLHTVTLTVDDVEFQTSVGFSYHLAPYAYGMLGQKGFFDRFSVNFELSKGEIELEAASL